MSKSSLEVIFRRDKNQLEEECSALSFPSDPRPRSKRSKSPSFPPNIEALSAHLVSRQITPVDRLFYRRKSLLDSIRERIEEPEKVLPQGRLPIWERIHLPCKVPAPNIPNHRIVWSRGKICQTLRPERSCPDFCLEDPYNRYRLVTGPYEPLHDENTKSYFQAPSVQKLLQDQGLVTPRGSVPCTLADFNNWRSQLNSAIYKNRVKKSLDQVVRQKEADAAQLKALTEYDRQEKFAKENSGREQKHKIARERADEVQIATIQKYQERLQKKEQRLRGCRVNLAKEQLERMLRADGRQARRHARLAQILNLKSAARQHLICTIFEKEAAAERRLEEKVRDDQREVEEQFESRIQAHYKVQEIENEREKFVAETLLKELTQATRRRQEAFAQAQASQRKKKAGNRRFDLALKYGRKWIEITAKRQMERCFAPHSSLFHIPSEVGATLDFLNSQGHGFEKASVPRPISAPTLQSAPTLSSSQLSRNASERGILEFMLNEARRPVVKSGRSRKGSAPGIDGTGDAGNSQIKGSETEVSAIGSFSSISSNSTTIKKGSKGPEFGKTAGGDNIIRN